MAEDGKAHAHDHDDSMFSTESWIKEWDAGSWGFHCTKVNDLLTKYYDRLVDDGSQMRFFLPLCGKSLDMKWLADKGHIVVGVDCARRAAVDFFAENKLEYTLSKISSVEDCTVYKSKDGLVEFYVCDFFALPKDLIKDFDVIWDRGSLNAMPFSKSSEYVEHIKKFMKPGTKILLDLFESYDDDGNIMMEDSSLLEADVRKLYDNCSCKVLGTYKYSDIAGDMCMKKEEEESFNKQMADQRKSGEDQKSEEGPGDDMFKNMIGRTYLLMVK